MADSQTIGPIVNGDEDTTSKETLPDAQSQRPATKVFELSKN